MCRFSDENTVTENSESDDYYYPTQEAYSLAQHIRSPNPNKRQRTDDSDFRPFAFVRLNTSLGKPKPKTIRALLDSGASESLVCREHIKKLRIKTSRAKSITWTTPSGEMTTDQTVKGQFTIPELQEKKLIEWELHITESLGSYDMIIGRDLMEFLGIDVRFSTRTIEWENHSMPFKAAKATVEEDYHVEESMILSEKFDIMAADNASKVKDILDAKYTAADLGEIGTKAAIRRRKERSPCSAETL